MQYELDQPNLVLAAPAKGIDLNFVGSEDATVDGGLFKIPPNVKVLPWPISERKFIVRFHNMNDKDAVKIDLKEFFEKLSNAKLTEMTVTGVQELKAMLEKKLDWTYNRDSWLKNLNTDYLDSN